MCRRRGFTIIELLVVIAIVAILAALLFPVFAGARAKAQQTGCSSNMQQIGRTLLLYLADYDERMPHRRDLKESLPGGYRPWASWPPSDPRVGWAAVVFEPYVRSNEIWSCPGTRATPLGQTEQAVQRLTAEEEPSTGYWMWRFDRPDDPVPLDNFWGKTEWKAIDDLRILNNPITGYPDGPSEVEMVVDPYFPSTIPSVSQELRGKTAHFRGRNRSFLDGHVKFMRDPRT